MVKDVPDSVVETLFAGGLFYGGFEMVLSCPFFFFFVLKYGLRKR